MTVVNINPSPSRATEIGARIVPISDIRPNLTSNYLVKGWLSTNALTVLFGASNTGKTFVAVDFGLHVAAGLAWRGRRVRKGPVIYVAGEGGGGIHNRIVAAKDDRPDFASAEFYLLPLPLDLHGDIDALALCEAMPCEDPALIVIDTLARSMGIGDENSTKDMNQFIASCDLLRRATGAHVMVVHHTGKDQSRGARGASSLYAATDTEVKITTEGEIECTKQRDMSYPEKLHFQLRQVTLGLDDEGDEVTSAVVDPAEPPKQQRKPLSGRNEVAMQALFDALRDHGATRSSDNFPADRKVVAVGYWRDACATHGLTTGISESAARTAFMRAKTKLIDLNEVREWGDHVWKVHEDD